MMTTADKPPLRLLTEEDDGRRKPAVANEVLGMTIFILAECMLFAGFVSAFVVVKANYIPGAWPPPDQPRLPIEATAATTLMLLASGFLVWRAGRLFEESPENARRPMMIGVGLGALFVGIQGVEWARLIGQGLTLTSSTYGGFFYLIVGAHALHAFPAIAWLVFTLRRLQDGTLERSVFTAARMFWYFVVLVWPVIYWKVYL